MRVKIRRGLDLPIQGAPEATVRDARPARHVALLPPDHPGLVARLVVREGEPVRAGQPLFVDRREPVIRFVSPRTGTVARIHEGGRRAVQAVVVAVDGDEEHVALGPPHATWHGDEAVRASLCDAGLWPALRSRPFGGIPRREERAAAIFVTAVDTNPLAGPLEAVLAPHVRELARGVEVLAELTPGRVHVCTGPEAPHLPVDHPRVRVTAFEGPHPAGLVGTHMHVLDPPRADRRVWYVGWQDVVAIGHLAATGVLWNERYVALGGPPVRTPGWLRTTPGAAVADLVAGELDDGACRVISGSVLNGRQAAGWGAFLGRYHAQVSVIDQPGPPRRGGARRPFSFHRLLRRWRPRSRWSTATHGEAMPLIPLDTFERVVPLDILATTLLRALLVGDVDAAERLGCLELEEEDLALCTVLCPSKIDHGARLRAVLEQLGTEMPGDAA